MQMSKWATTTEKRVCFYAMKNSREKTENNENEAAKICKFLIS